MNEVRYKRFLMKMIGVPKVPDVILIWIFNYVTTELNEIKEYAPVYEDGTFIYSEVYLKLNRGVMAKHVLYNINMIRLKLL